AYAEALEIIPTVLAESAGMDALETLLKLRALHNQGYKFAGVDVMEAKVVEDMLAKNVYEPILVKKQVIKSASEAATSILKIDDVIAAAAPKKEKKKGEEEEEEGESGPGSFNF
ncbi:MAG: thermosome subunit, partial [Desulfurococcales archaeon]|nr:thermosome subunit [Desulfurococcales archaeon]